MTANLQIPTLHLPTLSSPLHRGRHSRDKGTVGRAAGASGWPEWLVIISVLGPFLELPPGFTPKLGSQAGIPDVGDEFGRSVALDGNTLAVGAFLEDSAATGVDGDQNSDGAQGSGAVYMFRRTGTTWRQGATSRPRTRKLTTGSAFSPI